jgi:hypothetical protein
MDRKPIKSLKFRFSPRSFSFHYRHPNAICIYYKFQISLKSQLPNPVTFSIFTDTTTSPPLNYHNYRPCLHFHFAENSKTFYTFTNGIHFSSVSFFLTNIKNKNRLPRFAFSKLIKLVSPPTQHPNDIIAGHTPSFESFSNLDTQFPPHDFPTSLEKKIRPRQLTPRPSRLSCRGDVGINDI